MSDWKEVVHIEDRVGPRGGECWFLTLECGHHHTKIKRTFKLYRLLTSQLQFAPKRVKCIVCRALRKAPSSPPRRTPQRLPYMRGRTR